MAAEDDVRALVGVLLPVNVGVGAEEGLGGALESLAARTPLEVTLDGTLDNWDGAWPREVLLDDEGNVPTEERASGGS